MKKFVCTVEMLNRLAVASGLNGRTKPYKGVIQLRETAGGTLTLCISNKTKIREFPIVMLGKVRSNFLDEGKLTLEFREPMITVMLRDADKATLSTLLDLIQNQKAKDSAAFQGNSPRVKRPLGPTSSECKAGPSSENIPETHTPDNDASSIPSNKRPKLAPTAAGRSAEKGSLTTPVSNESVTLKATRKALREHSMNLRVTKRSDYPSKCGFSSHLVNLHLNGIDLVKIDSRILALKNLSVLNLSENRLYSVERLTGLNAQLSWLILDSNRVEKISEDFFSSPPMSTLTTLSLKQNQLVTLPRSVVKLKNLRVLNVSGNLLKFLPYNIHELWQLIRLEVNENNLTFLPFVVTLLSLSQLDISGNPWPTAELHQSHRVGLDPSFPTLFELTAGALRTHNYRQFHNGTYTGRFIETETLPAIAKDFLESCKLCTRCNRLTPRYTLVSAMLSTAQMAERITTPPGMPYVHCRKVVCDKCFER